MGLFITEVSVSTFTNSESMVVTRHDDLIYVAGLPHAWFRR